MRTGSSCASILRHTAGNGGTMSDAVLLAGASTEDQNLYFRTRFLAGDPFLYVEQDDRSTLVVPRMERGRALLESSVTDVRGFDEFKYIELFRQFGDSWSALGQVALQLLNEYGARTVQVEPTLPMRIGTVLQDAGIEVAIDPAMFDDARRRKSADEVRAIEAAQAGTERAVARAIEIIERSEIHAGALHLAGIPLTSERVRAEIESALLRDGLIAEHQSIVAGGPASADPHAVGEGALRACQPIIMDVFPRDRTSRLHADLTRTVIKGTPPEELTKMYDAVFRAQETALAMIAPGVNGSEIHRAVLAVLAEAGFGVGSGRASMEHGTGHGLGLSIHEAPRLGEVGDDLMEGEVVTVEPGLYHPALGGIRIEDVVVVTASGCRNLTTLSKRFELA